MAKRVLCILAEGFEEVEAVTPVDMIRRAGIEVIVAGLSGIDIAGSHGITLLADCEFGEITGEDFDAVFLPGGKGGAENMAATKEVIDYINDMFGRGCLIAAICATPGIVLGKTKVLSGKKATCYPSFEKFFPADAKYTDERVVVDGNVITGKAAGASAEFSSAIITYLTNKENADKVFSAMFF
ncbi:MAG: DJ-1/PfpI family protein [Spirochaetaceae bacterium]|nr:DJ-1/PfpI family protein [Spirochaetaceae bacterium]